MEMDKFTQDEIELIEMADDIDHLYDRAYFIPIRRQIVIDKSGGEINKGYFKVFAYKDSLRFLVFMTNSLTERAADWFAEKINKYIGDLGKSSVKLRYAQVNGFSDILLNKFDSTDNYHYYRHCQHRLSDSISISEFPELQFKSGESKAILLYEKIGVKKLYEARRININAAKDLGLNYNGKDYGD